MRQLANPNNHVLTEAQAATFAGVLKALASPHRLRIVSLLAHAVGGMQQHEIVALMPIDQATVSLHLRMLRWAELVERKTEGRYVRYRLVPGALDHVASFLAGGR